MARRPSPQTVRVLDALIENGGNWSHGYELSKRLGLASGTLYPILMRLEKRGHLETRWEPSPLEGRPPRHVYRLTNEGRKWAQEAVQTRPANIARQLGEATA